MILPYLQFSLKLIINLSKKIKTQSNMPASFDKSLRNGEYWERRRRWSHSSEPCSSGSKTKTLEADSITTEMGRKPAYYGSYSSINDQNFKSLVKVSESVDHLSPTTDKVKDYISLYATGLNAAWTKDCSNNRKIPRSSFAVRAIPLSHGSSDVSSRASKSLHSEVISSENYSMEHCNSLSERGQMSSQVPSGLHLDQGLKSTTSYCRNMPVVTAVILNSLSYSTNCVMSSYYSSPRISDQATVDVQSAFLRRDKSEAVTNDRKFHDHFDTANLKNFSNPTTKVDSTQSLAYVIGSKSTKHQLSTKRFSTSIENDVFVDTNSYSNGCKNISVSKSQSLSDYPDEVQKMDMHLDKENGHSGFSLPLPLSSKPCVNFSSGEDDRLIQRLQHCKIGENSAFSHFKVNKKLNAMEKCINDNLSMHRNFRENIVAANSPKSTSIYDENTYKDLSNADKKYSGTNDLSGGGKVDQNSLQVGKTEYHMTSSNMSGITHHNYSTDAYVISSLSPFSGSCVQLTDDIKNKKDCIFNERTPADYAKTFQSKNIDRTRSNELVETAVLSSSSRQFFVEDELNNFVIDKNHCGSTENVLDISESEPLKHLHISDETKLSENVPEKDVCSFEKKLTTSNHEIRPNSTSASLNMSVSSDINGINDSKKELTLKEDHFVGKETVAIDKLTIEKLNKQSGNIEKHLKRAEADILVLNEIIREACLRLEVKCQLKNKLLKEKNRIANKRNHILKEKSDIETTHSLIGVHLKSSSKTDHAAADEEFRNSTDFIKVSGPLEETLMHHQDPITSVCKTSDGKFSTNGGSSDLNISTNNLITSNRPTLQEHLHNHAEGMTYKCSIGEKFVKKSESLDANSQDAEQLKSQTDVVHRTVRSRSASVPLRRRLKTKKTRDLFFSRSPVERLIFSDASDGSLREPRPSSSLNGRRHKMRRKRTSPTELSLRKYLHQSSSSDIDIEGLDSFKFTKLNSIPS